MPHAQVCFIGLDEVGVGSSKLGQSSIFFTHDEAQLIEDVGIKRECGLGNCRAAQRRKTFVATEATRKARAEKHRANPRVRFAQGATAEY